MKGNEGLFRAHSRIQYHNRLRPFVLTMFALLYVTTDQKDDKAVAASFLPSPSFPFSLASILRL